MSFTKYPMNPIRRKPTAHAHAIFLNSRASGFVHLQTTHRGKVAPPLGVPMDTTGSALGKKSLAAEARTF